MDVATELTITGTSAQFGRCIMQNVAGRLVSWSAGNLEQSASARGEGAAPEAIGAAPIKTADSVNFLTSAGAPVRKRVASVVIAFVGAMGAIRAIIMLVNR